MSIGPSIPEIHHFQNLTLKIKSLGQMTLLLHNYRSRQVHKTSNGMNPYSGFKDMGSAKSGPSAAWFDRFLAKGQAHMGQMGKLPWQCKTRDLDNSTELRVEKSVKRLQRYGFRKSGSRPSDRPDRDDNTPPGDLRGKIEVNVSMSRIFIKIIYHNIWIWTPYVGGITWDQLCWHTPSVTLRL